MGGIPSVLLIVGTILIGPIFPESTIVTEDEYLALSCDNLRGTDWRQCRVLYGPADKEYRKQRQKAGGELRKYETISIDDLCRRALEQIGATEISPDGREGWLLRGESPLVRELVRCLPTPTGLQK